MPYAPKKHKPRRGRKRRPRDDRAAEQKGNGFYDRARWRRLRMAFLKSNPLCIDPFGHHGDDTPVAAEHVDHVKPRSERADLEYAWGNLQSLCASCHSTKTGKEREGRARQGRERGERAGEKKQVKERWGGG